MTEAGGTDWPARRFSQAISEGDGISVIPLVGGDVEGAARAAEAAGAEALALESVSELARARAVTGLPLILRLAVSDVESLRAARAVGADACVLAYDDWSDEGELLEQIFAEAVALGLDLAVDVRDEDELEDALEHLDPEIVLLSERDRDEDEVELEVTLDLLPDVPAGKLVVSDAGVTHREQVLALERAGVDAVLVSSLGDDPAFSGRLAELTGRA